MAAQRTPGLWLFIVGGLLVPLGPALGITLWFLLRDPPSITMVATFATQAIGIALVVAGAVRNARSRRQLPSPPNGAA